MANIRPTPSQFRKKLKSVTTPVDDKLYGTLGLPDGTVEVPGKTNWHYITLAGSGGSVVQARNTFGPPSAGLKVVLRKIPDNPAHYYVADVRPAYSDDFDFPLIGRHGRSHDWRAGDEIRVYLRQLRMLRVTPATAGGIAIDVESGRYETASGGSALFPTTTNISLTAHVPASGARWVRVELDNAGVLQYADGTAKTPGALAETDIPVHTAGRSSLAAVRLMAGQATIRDTLNDPDLLDLRFSDAGGGGSGSGDMLAATYDPQSIAADAFDLANQTGVLGARHFEPLLVTPLSGMTIAINVIPTVRNRIDDSNDDTWGMASPSTIDLTDSVPVSGARYVLVYLHSIASSGSSPNIYTIDGGTVANRAALSLSDIPTLFWNEDVGGNPLAAVILEEGQTSVLEADILDLRFAGIDSGGPVMRLSPTNAAGNRVLIWQGGSQIGCSTKTVADLTPPTTTAENDVQVGGVDGTAGTWVTKTLAQFVTILRTSLDGIYAALAHTHAYVPTARTLTTTSPLTIGGGASADLSADRTLAIPAATASVPGHATAAQITKLDGIAAGANLYVHPNHSGDVTSAGDGATTIGAGKVTLAMMANMATASLIYRKSAGAGAPEVNTLAQLKTDLVITAADVAAVPNDGWISTAWANLTRSSATVFTTTTDVSAIIGAGTKLKFTDTTTKYLVVLSAIFAAGTCTITTLATSDYAFVGNPSAVFYSNVENPFGWPGWFAFTTTVTGFSANPTTTLLRYNAQGRKMKIAIRQNPDGTSNATTLTLSLPAPAATVTTMIWLGWANVIDNSVSQANPGVIYISSAGTVLNVTKDSTLAGFTTSGGKRCAIGNIDYQW